MFHNYFFLKRLATSLDKVLKHQQLVACFSQNKDELILIFTGTESSFTIRANLSPSVSLLQFSEQFSRAGKNSIDLFSELLHKEVAHVGVYEFERSFFIEFTNNDLLIFKMHGRRSNVLHANEDRVITIFRNNLNQDLEIIPSELHKTIEISEETLADHQYEPLQMLPALGKEVKIALENEGYTDLPDREKWTVLKGKLSSLDQNPISLIEGSSPRISLLERSTESTHDPIVAVNWFYEKSTRILFFEKEKEHLINELKRKIRKSESYISKSQEKLNQIISSRNPEEIANILMVNLHSIQKGLSKVVLTDFYQNQPITIKLNTQVSPQKNAENYYRKSKNRHQEINNIKSNIEGKEELIHALSKQILEIQDLSTSKELRKFKKAHSLSSKKEIALEIRPYHLFELENWQILVGKNSKANDELTLKVANKNDLWLHAKDVAGSHVIVKEHPGQNYPAHIIEYAASLAAANSKRKTDTLCPVIYTPKKFVRKVKGSPAGAVIVEKEEVVMVAPYSPKE